MIAGEVIIVKFVNEVSLSLRYLGSLQRSANWHLSCYRFNWIINDWPFSRICFLIWLTIENKRLSNHWTEYLIPWKFSTQFQIAEKNS